MNECPICFNWYSDKRVPACFPCGHVFCLSCIAKLTKAECPTCHRAFGNPQYLIGPQQSVDVVTRLYFDFTGGNQKNKLSELNKRVESLTKESARYKEGRNVVKEQLQKERTENAAKIRKLEKDLEKEKESYRRLKNQTAQLLPAFRMTSDVLNSITKEVTRSDISSSGGAVEQALGASRNRNPASGNHGSSRRPLQDGANTSWDADVSTLVPKRAVPSSRPKPVILITGSQSGNVSKKRRLSSSDSGSDW